MSHILSISSFAAILIATLGMHQQQMPGHAQEQSRCAVSPSYRKGRIAHSAPGYPKELFFYVSVEPNYFVERDMRALACDLKKQFPSESRFTAVILDDDDALRHTSPIHRTREFLLARRGYYHID